jgi:branched-chain amino acid transport system permease protein
MNTQLRRLEPFIAVLVVVLTYPFLDQLLLTPLCRSLPSAIGWIPCFFAGRQNTLIPIGIAVILALGLNVVVGFAGLLDLGYAAFFAIGAYTAAFLTSPTSPIPYFVEHPLDFWLTMIVSAVVAALFGVLLGAPTLRLRGDYLAIVTLGFGEIVPLVVRNADQLTKGTQGMNPIGTPTLPVLGRFPPVETLHWYYLVIAVVLLSVLLTARLRTSRLGRAWMAIREDEVAAASMGINPVTTKLWAFSLGASFSGFAGSISASYLQVIAPEQFRFDVSIMVLSMIIVGGMGNIYGVIAGGVILGAFDRALAPQLTAMFRDVGGMLNIEGLRDIDVSNFRTLVFGLSLVVMMLLRPEGLFPSARRKAELHAAEESEVEAAQQREMLYEAER